MGRSGRCCGLNGSGDTGLLRVETEADESELDAPLAVQMRRSSAGTGEAWMGEMYVVDGPAPSRGYGE